MRFERNGLKRWAVVSILFCATQAVAVGVSAQETARPRIGVRAGLAHLGTYHGGCDSGHLTGGFQLQYVGDWYAGAAIDGFVEPSAACGQLIVRDVRNGREIWYSVRDLGMRYSAEAGINRTFGGVGLEVGPSIGIWTGGSVWLGASGAVSVLSGHLALRAEYGRDGVLWRSNEGGFTKRIWDSLSSLTIVARY